MESFKEHMLGEVFVDFAKGGYGSTPMSIFKNPRSSEVEDAANEGKYRELRGFVDRDGKGDVYLWNGDIEHMEAYRKLSGKLKGDYAVPVWFWIKTKNDVEISKFSMAQIYGVEDPDQYYDDDWGDDDDDDAARFRDDMAEAKAIYDMMEKNLKRNAKVKVVFKGKTPKVYSGGV